MTNDEKIKILQSEINAREKDIQFLQSEINRFKEFIADVEHVEITDQSIEYKPEGQNE